MSAKVKCQYCGEYGHKEDMVYIETGKKKVVKKYYHEECLKIKELDSVEYKKLIEYVCNLFDIDKPTGMMMKQIKEYRQEYNYRYFAIQLALEYFFVVKDNKIPEHKTLGIVPYIMEDAKKYYTHLAQLPNREIHVKSVTTHIHQPTKRNRKKKLIDISEL